MRVDIIDGINWGENYSQENRKDCKPNRNSGYVEVYISDGNILRLNCEEVAADLHTTEQALVKLHKLLDDKPTVYVSMALSKGLQVIVT